MKNFLRDTLWQEEFASGRMGRALDILLLFFLLFFFRYYLLTSLDLEMTLQTYLPTSGLISGSGLFPHGEETGRRVSDRFVECVT